MSNILWKTSQFCCLLVEPNTPSITILAYPLIMGAAFIQCPVILNSLRSWHLFKNGHVLWPFKDNLFNILYFFFTNSKPPMYCYSLYRNCRTNFNDFTSHILYNYCQAYSAIHLHKIKIELTRGKGCGVH